METRGSGFCGLGCGTGDRSWRHMTLHVLLATLFSRSPFLACFTLIFNLGFVLRWWCFVFVLFCFHFAVLYIECWRAVNLGLRTIWWLMTLPTSDNCVVSNCKTYTSFSMHGLFMGLSSTPPYVDWIYLSRPRDRELNCIESMSYIACVAQKNKLRLERWEKSL